MKLSKISIPYRTLSKFTTLIVFALFFGGASLIAESPLGLLIFILFSFTLIGIVSAYEYLYWRNYNYEINEEGLEISAGVVSKKTVDIPLRRIQNVDVDRTVFQRLFGIARVRVETAGGDTSEANFRYLEYDKARQVQKKIRELKNRRADPEQEIREKEDFRLTDRNLLVLSAVSIEPRIVFSYITFVAVLAGVTAGYFNIGAAAVLSSTGLVLMATAAIVFAWFSSAFSSILTFYDFKLGFKDNALEYEKGLLHRSSGTIPEEKIQNLLVEENFLKRWLGYATLKVETAGYGPEQQLQGSETAIPLAPREEIVEMAEEISGFEIPELDKVDRKAEKRYFRRYILIGLALIPITGLLNVLTPVGAVVYTVPLIVLTAARSAAKRKWRNIGYRIGEDQVYTRKGYWNRKTYSVPYFRLQNLVKTQTIFQKRWDMVSVNVDTAGSTLTNPVIPDIQEESSEKVMEDVFKKFKQSI